MSFLPTNPILYPALSAFLLYGGRFLLFAGTAYFFTNQARKRPWGRPHLVAPDSFDFSRHIKRELKYSLISLIIFSIINALLYGYGLIGESQIYFAYNQYPIWWFWLSIPVMIFFHDTLFYWLHRLMHTKFLFKIAHRVHHQSIYPTAFTSYSFSWLEGLFEALIVVSLIFVIPVHIVAFIIFQTISIAYNVYGHCGREFLPISSAEHWLGKWLNASTMHAYHHRYGHGNYSFYFSFWDRLMGTLELTKS